MGTDDIPKLSERFELGEEIGRGGFGVVRAATDRRDGFEVAVKLPLGRTSGRERDRALREARLIRELDHPNLVRFHGVFLHDDGELALVYQRLRGEALEDRPPMAPSRMLEVAGEIAEGLEALAGKGLVHRDLKPANVFLTEEGGVVLLDFGLLKPDQQGDTLTETGIVIGTPAFMAPEQFTEGKLDPRTDVYALGCLIYWMLTGSPPFKGSAVEVMTGHLQRTPFPPETRVETPPALGKALLRALEKEPSRRPSSARELVRQLKAALTSAEETLEIPGDDPRATRLSVLPGSGLDTTRKTRRRRRLGGLALAFGGIAVLAIGLRSGTGPAGPSTTAPTEPASVPRPVELPAVQSLRTILLERLTGREGAPPLSRSPGEWSRAFSEFPAITRVHDWIQRGGDPARLDEELRIALLDLDEVFQRADQARPFFPFLHEQPASEAKQTGPRVQELADDFGLGASLPALTGGWTARCLERLEFAIEESLRITADFGPEDFPTHGLVRELASTSPSGRNPWDWIREGWADNGVQANLYPRLRRGCEAMSAALYCSGRAVLAEEDHAGVLADVLVPALLTMRGFLLGVLPHEDPLVLLSVEEPEGTDPFLAAGLMMERNRTALRGFNKVPVRTRDEWRAWERVLEQAGSLTAGPSRAHRLAYARYARFTWLRVAREYKYGGTPQEMGSPGQELVRVLEDLRGYPDTHLHLLLREVGRQFNWVKSRKALPELSPDQLRRLAALARRLEPRTLVPGYFLGQEYWSVLEDAAVRKG